MARAELFDDERGLCIRITNFVTFVENDIVPIASQKLVPMLNNSRVRGDEHSSAVIDALDEGVLLADVRTRIVQNGHP